MNLSQIQSAKTGETLIYCGFIRVARVQHKGEKVIVRMLDGWNDFEAPNLATAQTAILGMMMGGFEAKELVRFI